MRESLNLCVEKKKKKKLIRGKVNMSERKFEFVTGLIPDFNETATYPFTVSSTPSTQNFCTFVRHKLFPPFCVTPL